MSAKELQNLPSQRVKRILANRDSAARSKERKLQYIGKLESQVDSCVLSILGLVDIRYTRNALK